jgi:hypothetical protein
VFHLDFQVFDYQCLNKNSVSGVSLFHETPDETVTVKIGARQFASKS